MTAPTGNREGRRGTYRIGLLAPFAELPGEYADAAAGCPDDVRIWQVVTPSVDSHRPDDLVRMGSDEVLADGVKRLLRWRPDVVAWACTSGSFVEGLERAHQQRDMLEAASGLPATSTSLAFLSALARLGIDRVAVVSPYPEAATQALVRFLGAAGIAVDWARRLDAPGARVSELIAPEQIAGIVRTVPGGLTVLVPDTATWGFSFLEHLRGTADSGRCVLTANQVTLWECLRLAGGRTDAPALGTLAGLT